MEITVGQLRETYARKETDELLDLRARNELTDVARIALDEELQSRGVQDTEVARVSEQREQNQAVVEKGTSNLAPELHRLAAWLIDVWGALGVMVAIYFPLFIYMPKSIYDPLDKMSLPLYFGYLLFKDAWRGQSIGKRILRIKVVHKTTGRPCSAPQSFLRNLLHILGIFDWVFIFGKEKRRLGDIAANTCVVRK